MWHKCHILGVAASSDVGVVLYIQADLMPISKATATPCLKVPHPVES